MYKKFVASFRAQFLIHEVKQVLPTMPSTQSVKHVSVRHAEHLIRGNYGY